MYRCALTAGKTNPRRSAPCAAHGAFTEVKAARSLPAPPVCASPPLAVLCRSLFVVWSSMSQEAVVGGLVIAGAALVVNGCPLSHMPNIACCYRMPLNSPASGRQSHHALLLPLRRHRISHLPDVCVSGCRPVCFVPNRIVVLIHSWRVTLLLPPRASPRAQRQQRATRVAHVLGRLRLLHWYIYTPAPPTQTPTRFLWQHLLFRSS